MLQQNGEFPQGIEITGIKDCSFIILELIDWLGIETVEFRATENQELIAAERNLPPLVLHRLQNPRVEIRFESESLTNYHDIDTHYNVCTEKSALVFLLNTRKRLM